MIEEDREAIRKMKADFEALAMLSESEFQDHTSFERRMNHYSTVYTAATRNAPKASEFPGYDVGELLYMDFQEMLTRCLLRYRNVTSSSDMELFTKILKVWGHYSVLMKWNIRTFAYLSRYYIANHSKPSLRQVALSIFLEQIFRKKSAVMSRVTLDLLFRERVGELVDHRTVTSAVQLLSAMSIDNTEPIYVDEFLTPYLQRTGEHYEELTASWASTYSSTDFLLRVERSLAEEVERCKNYFPPDHEDIIMQCVEKTILESPLTQEKLLDTADGFSKALQERDMDLLKTYYSIFSRRESGIVHLSARVKKEIELEGERVARRYDGEDAPSIVASYVNEMMALLDSYQLILSQCFNLQLTISQAVREGLETVFSGGVMVTDKSSGNQRSVLFSEWLALFIDKVMQEDRSSIDEDVERVVAALSYVSERDRFLAFSRELMARRIVFPVRKFNDVAERQLLHCIRQRCGPASTTHLEGMLYDIDVSRSYGVMVKLRDAGVSPEISVSLLVGKKGLWPSSICSHCEIRLPENLEILLESVRRVYLHGTTERVLMWCHESSTAEVVGRFAKGSQMLCISAVQCLTLLAFNTAASITVSDIVARYNIPIELLGSALPPLIKGRVLVRKSTQPTLGLADEIMVNDQYSCHGRKQRFPPSLTLITPIHSEGWIEQLEEDRKPTINACIVRIMKSHRVMQHTELLEECQKQLESYFNADVKTMKQQVEELIRKEYIQRDPKNNGVYRYVA